MRNVYITVAVLFFLTIFLFVSSFFYLDKVKHQTLYYTLNLGGVDIGIVKIDKFDTEDKLIYKSISDMPFGLLWTEGHSRITLNRKYELEGFLEENLGRGANEMVCIENRSGAVSFVTKSQSIFACLENIPLKNDTFVFKEDSLLTYLPIIENYNFSRGRSQGFNGLTYFSGSLLPPVKRFITLTSMKDEYLKIDRRKIKTEYLMLKIKNYPPGSLWVAKSDRTVIKIELPKMGLTITRTFHPKVLPAKEYVPEVADYASKEVSFKSGNIQLSGIATYPKTEGKNPAVLLVGGPIPQDRDYEGLFTSIADYLSKNGFYVLRFDRRGLGNIAGGDIQSSSFSDKVDHVAAALKYMSGQKEVDPDRVSVIGHSEGACYASKVASENNIVKSLVLMAPIAHLGLEDEGLLADLKNKGSTNKWSEDYMKLVAKSIDETKNKLKKFSSNWANILGRRCFLKTLREEMAERPTDTLKRIKIPVLILQGKGDEETFVNASATLDKALEEAGNPSHSLTYYGYLGHFFGKEINDGVHQMHYEADKDVLDGIKNWLAKNPA